MRRPKTFVSVISIAISLACTASLGNTYSWMGSGDFSVPTRWSPSGVPGIADSAVFNNGSWVNFTGSATNQDLFVNGSTQFVSTGGPFTYTVANNATVSNSNLMLAVDPMPGHAINLSVGGQLNFNYSSGSIQYGSQVTAGSLLMGAASLNVDGAALNVTGNTVLGGGSILHFFNGAVGNLGGTATLAPSNFGSGPNSLNVEDGAQVTTGNIVAGNSNQSGCYGYIAIRGPNTLLAQTDASTITLGSASAGIGSVRFCGDSGTFTTGTGNIVVNATGLIDVEGGGTFNANGDIYVNTTGGTGQSEMMDIKLNVAGSGSAVIQSGACSMTIGSATGASNATVAVNNQAVFTTGTGITTINKSGLLSLQSSGIFNLNGNMVIDGGTLNVDGGFLNVGVGRSVTAQHGGQMMFINVFPEMKINQYATYSVASGADMIVVSPILAVGYTTDGSLVADGAGSSVSASSVYVGRASANGTVIFRDGATGSFSFLGIGKEGSGTSTMSVESGAHINLSGSMVVGPASGNPNGTLIITGTNSQIIQTGSLSSLYIGGYGGFAGTDVVNVRDGGLFATIGSVTVNTGGTLNIDGGTVSVGPLTAIGGGKVNFTAGSLSFINDLHVETTGLLGPSVNLTAGKTLSTGSATTYVAFLSKLAVNGGTLTTELLNNYGKFSIAAGSTVNVSLAANNKPGATLSLEKDAVLNTQVFNDGEVILGGGTATLGAPFYTLTNTGIIHGDGRIASSVINTIGAELRADFTNRMVLSAPGNTNSGQISLSFGGTMEAKQGLINTSAGVISGDGVIRTGKITYSSGPVPSGTGLFNYGKMNFSGTTKVYGDVWTEGGDSCDIIVSGGASLTFYDNVYMRDTVAGSSKPEIRAGAGSRIVYFGLLKGDVNMTGTGVHSIEGTFSPGFSPGYASISNIELTSSGIFGFDLAGTTRMSDATIDSTGHYSAYDILNDLTLAAGGTIDVNLVPTQAPHQTGTLFVPSFGQEFVLMTWHNLIGDPTGVAINFDDAVLPDGMSWRTIWGPADNGSLVLEVVPEPASLALLAFGSASLLIRRRHRV